MISYIKKKSVPDKRKGLFCEESSPINSQSYNHNKMKPAGKDYCGRTGQDVLTLLNIPGQWL